MNKTINELKEKLEQARKWFLPLTCIVIVVAIIAMYVASLFGANIAITDMANFVSIILGLIAFSASIIATLLSFYNLEKSESINNEQHAAIRKMTEIQEEMSRTLKRIETNTNKFFRRSTVTIKDITQKSDDDWENEGETDE